MEKPFVLGVDQGGYCCSALPLVIKQLRRKKLVDEMLVTQQYQQSYGKFKATLVELLWNNNKTKVSARFCGDILDKVPGGYTNPN